MPPPPPAMMHAPNPADANDTHILRHQFDRFNATAADAAQQPAASSCSLNAAQRLVAEHPPDQPLGARWSRYWKDSHDDAARCAPGQRWWRRAESSCSPSPTERLPSSRNASAQPFLLCPMASPSGPLQHLPLARVPLDWDVLEAAQPRLPSEAADWDRGCKDA